MSECDVKTSMEQREAVGNIIGAAEFEVYTIEKVDGGTIVKGISSSTRKGSRAMLLDMLKNARRQWGEVWLGDVLVDALKDCTEATLDLLRQSVSLLIKEAQSREESDV